MNNPFQSKRPGTTGFVYDLVPVDPAVVGDNIDGGKAVAVGLYIETGGTLQFKNVEGITRTLKVPDYHTMICTVRQVVGAGTTALGIHAMVV